MSQSLQIGQRVRIARCSDEYGNAAYVGRTATIIRLLNVETESWEVAVDGPHVDWWMDEEANMEPNHSAYYTSELEPL